MAVSETYFTNNGSSLLDRWILSYDTHHSVRNICLGAFGTVINIVAFILIQVKTDMKLAARIKFSTLIITDLCIVLTTALYGITGVAQFSISTCWFVSFTFVLLEMASHSTVAVISILNSVAVCYPVYFRDAMTPARVVYILVGMWVTDVLFALSCVGFGIHGDNRCLPLGLLPTHGLLLFVSITGTCDLLTISLTITICFKLRSRRTARKVLETRGQRKNCLRTFCQAWSTRTREHNTDTGVSQAKLGSCSTTLTHHQGVRVMEHGEYLIKEDTTDKVCIVSKTSLCGNSERTLGVLTTKGNISYGAASSSQTRVDKSKSIGENNAFNDALKRNLFQTNACSESTYWTVKTEERSPDSADTGERFRLRETASEPVEDDDESSANIVSRKWSRNATNVLKCRSSKFEDNEGRTLSPVTIDCKNDVTAIIEVTSLEVEGPLESEYWCRVGKDVPTSRSNLDPPRDSSLANEVKSVLLASEGIDIICGFNKRSSHYTVCLAASDPQPHSPTQLINFRGTDFTNRRCQVDADTIFSNPRPGSPNNSCSLQINNSSISVSSSQHQSLHDSHKASTPSSSSPPTVEIANKIAAFDRQYVKVKASAISGRIIATLTFLTMWSGIIHFVSLLILLWMIIFESEKQTFLVSPPGLVSSTLILFNALSNPVIYVWSLTKWKTLYRKISNSCTQVRR